LQRNLRAVLFAQQKDVCETCVTAGIAQVGHSLCRRSPVRKFWSLKVYHLSEDTILQLQNQIGF
jgi:hypothetical protein